MSDSSIRDNYLRGTVGEFLKEVILPESEVAIVSAYFTIYAYHQLKEKLDTITNLRFLFGEPTFIKSLDHDQLDTRSYKIEDDKLSIPLESSLSQKKLAKECSDWLQDKAEIRSMVKPNFLHGKLYHVKQNSGIEKAIAGSSNFTVNGLGLGGNKNIELNLVIDSDRERKELREWFDAIWDNNTGLVEDVKEDVLKYLQQLYKENSPEFIYFKTLYHVFENFIDEQQDGVLDEKTGFYDTEIWSMLYEFQKDGVKGIINKILKHDGCIVADSVGLGKTYEALAVIRYFELLNQRVLVICPKKLKDNWTVYQASQGHELNPFPRDRFGYTVVYHTDMGRESGVSDANGINLANFNWGAYDLIVIDESHNFRGNPMERVTENGTKMNRAKWLMEKVIKSGVKTKVLMLSATPVNNTLKDLRNQIAFITQGRDDALLKSCKITNIPSTLEQAQAHFTKWADPKKTPIRKTKQLLELLDTAFFRILDELTIARSRKHIKSFYKLEAIGKFPERNKPISVSPDIDLQNEFPTYDKVNEQILKYKLSVFNPSAYLKDDKVEKYEELAKTQGVAGFKQSDREYFLIGMMKVNYLKRLESSINSFSISLERTITKIENLEERITSFMTSELTLQEESLDSLEPNNDELEVGGDDNQQWEVGKKLKFDLADIKVEEWLSALHDDKERLKALLERAKMVTPDRDAKLEVMKELIRKKVASSENKKVVVFTAFSDTAKYIYENIKDWCKNDIKVHSALVSGSYTQTSLGKNKYDDILLNFSPVSKNRAKMTSVTEQEEISILVATDCISEGQNLQDCDYLINYDIHWNPVRIIQRFGRIDRLGSINKTVQLVNFWPTKDLDNYINLKERVEARMALVDVTATGEENILSTEQLEELISGALKYRDQQLKKLQNEVLDLEDMDDAISLTDFTLDDFRIELMNFINSNKRIKEAPFGLYAIIPTPSGAYNDVYTDDEFTLSEKEIIKPGVIFCLRQREDAKENDVINALSPYYLVYIYDDGEVKYNFTSAKHTLEVFRRLCQDKQEAYSVLCDVFNEETQGGVAMDKYTDLLKTSVNKIEEAFRAKGNQHLTSSRSALLIPMSNLSDFELITWLIVR